MTDNKPAAGPDVTAAWRATHDQASGATRLRIFAALAWAVAIGGEITGIVFLYQHKFDHGNLVLLIGMLVGIGIFAVAGNLVWKAANKLDPAKESEPTKFFIQNQLGAIITLIAFLPLIVLIFLDKDMDPKNKRVAGGVGAVLAVVAAAIGVSWSPPSVEKYTKDMTACEDQIKAGQPTTACSPEVAAQAQQAVTDSTASTTSTPPALQPSTGAAVPAATTGAAAPTNAALAADQFTTDADAKSHCPTDIVVWVNTKSKIYHFAGHHDYGATKAGAYMCRHDADAAGDRAAENEKAPK